jgi:hypothetical protein
MSLLPARLNVVIGHMQAHYRLPNLKNPQTFNEKIIWRKLYDRDSRLPDLVDKIKVKDHIASQYGADLIIPTLAVFDTVEAMDFSKPPLSQPPYVIKVNHSSSMNIFVPDHKDGFDPEAIKKKLRAYLKFDHAALAQEWAYANVQRRIFVEPFLTMPEGYLPDYRFHVFAGKIYAIETIVDIFGDDRCENMYDTNWNLLDVVHGNYPKYEKPLPRPTQLEEMVKLAETIGREFSYVRVDLYELNGAIKFGELTFYPGAGHEVFNPREWDHKFGQQWNLAGI